LPSAHIEIKAEERLIPFIRARLAKKLVRDGFRTKDVAAGLNLTPAAVTQYVKGKRGADILNVGPVDRLIDPLAEKVANRIRSGLGGVETVELLEAATQLKVLNSGRIALQRPVEGAERNKSLKVLRMRLRLELAASERYLELANRANDDYLKLLLRMIASDSMRHADVVSQVTSWLEGGHDTSYEVLSDAILREMRSIEDSAGESSLRKSVDVEHPVARLLLEWIDIDEEKHERMVAHLSGLNK
jgi:predicted transcriptional regulator/rubrerythrin